MKNNNKKAPSFLAQAFAAHAAPDIFTGDEATDRRQDMRYWGKRGQEIRDALDAHAKVFGRYTAYCDSHGLEPDEAVNDSVAHQRTEMESGLKKFQTVLTDVRANLDTLDVQGYAAETQKLRQQYRVLLLSKNHLFGINDYFSPAADQSIRPYFGAAAHQSEIVWQTDPEYQISQYDRNESHYVQDIEEMLIKTLGHDPARQVALLTSSCMAGLGTVERYLYGAGMVQTGDTVLIPYGTYGEASRRLFDHGVDKKRIVETSPEDVARDIRETGATALFLEPVKNAYAARAIPVVGILDAIGRQELARPVSVIIDNTLSPGGPDYFRHKNKNVEIFVVTGGKYLTLGQDNFAAGVIVADRAHAYGVQQNMQLPEDDKTVRYKKLQSGDSINQARKEMGTILYRSMAHGFPRYDREDFLYRQNRVTRNAVVMARILNASQRIAPLAKAVHPLNDDTPALPENMNCGGLISIQLPAVPDKDRHLKEMVHEILAVAREEKLDLTKGQGFGHTQPRIWLNRDGKDETGEVKTYLRLYAGDRTLTETVKVAEAIERGMHRYMRKMDLLPAPSRQPRGLAR